MSSHFGTLTGFIDRWRAHAKRRARHIELANLSDRMLRDLGLRRSELTSVLAESEGCAEVTRLRVLRGAGR